MAALQTAAAIAAASAISDRAAVPTCIAVCGAKGTGKSTWTRFMLNSLLNHHHQVAYLDTDCGQPELNPPGDNLKGVLLYVPLSTSTDVFRSWEPDQCLQSTHLPHMLHVARQSCCKRCLTLHLDGSRCPQRHPDLKARHQLRMQASVPMQLLSGCYIEDAAVHAQVC